jgi:hypothetical protein
MIVVYFDTEFNIPDPLIANMTELFKRNEEMKADMEVLREMVYHILQLAELDPRILNRQDRYDEFVNALAIKEALQANNLLFNA